MTWCPRAASHYLSKCRPRSTSTYGVTRPQWVYNFFYYFHNIVFLVISQHSTLGWHAFPLNHIFILAYLLPLSFAHLPQQKKHHFNWLFSIKSIAGAHPSFLLEEAILFNYIWTALYCLTCECFWYIRFITRLCVWDSFLTCSFHTVASRWSLTKSSIKYSRTVNLAGSVYVK